MAGDIAMLGREIRVFSMSASSESAEKRNSDIASFSSFLRQSVRGCDTLNDCNAFSVRAKGFGQGGSQSACAGYGRESRDFGKAGSVYRDYTGDVKNTDGVSGHETVTDAAKATEAGNHDGLLRTSDTDSDGMLKDLEKAVGELQEAVAELLGISEDELKKMMENMGISAAGLIKTPVLTELVLKVNNEEDMSAVLMNDGMCEQLTKLIGMVEQVLADNGITREEAEGILQGRGLPEGISKGNGDISEDTVLQEAADNETEMREFDFSVVRSDDRKSDAGDGEGSSFDMKGFNGQGRRAEGRNEVSNQSPADEFLAGLNNAMKLGDTDGLMGMGQVNVRDIVYQIAEQIKVVLSPSQTTLEMQLNPENLGRVALNISSKDGVMTAQITTQNQVTKEAIESQMQILKENIEAQGIKVEAIEVTVSNFSFSQSRNTESDTKEQQKGSHKGISVLRRGFEESEGDGHDEPDRIVLRSGSTVEYSA